MTFYLNSGVHVLSDLSHINHPHLLAGYHACLTNGGDSLRRMILMISYFANSAAFLPAVRPTLMMMLRQLPVWCTMPS